MASVPALLALVLMLALARRRERGRQAQLEGQLTGVLTGDAREVLAYVMLPIRGTRIAAELSLDAADRSNVRLLRAAVRVARVEAPRVAEGLRVMLALSRIVDVMVDLPPVAPTAWSAWRLRGLATAGVALHYVLVAGGERARLRLWILGQALRLCVRWLRVGAVRVATEAEAWHYVLAVAQDLNNATTEAERTYRRLVEGLDAIGAFELRRGNRLTSASG